MDWTQIILTALMALPSTIAAIAAAVVSVRNSTKIDQTSKKVDDNTQITTEAKHEAKQAAVDVATSAATKVTESVVDIKKTINGRMDELLALTSAKAYAEGIKAGKELLEAQAAALKASVESLALLKSQMEDAMRPKPETKP
jgi:hypothetical protein